MGNLYDVIHIFLYDRPMFMGGPSFLILFFQVACFCMKLHALNYIQIYTKSPFMRLS